MKRTQRRSGVALVLAIVVLTILVVVVLQLVFTTRVEMALARNGRDDRDMERAAMGALELARVHLEAGSAADPDTLASAWAGEKTGIRLGGAEVRLEIIDEARKFNLRLLVSKNEGVRAWAEEALVRVLSHARGREEDVDEPDPEALAERIVAWARKGVTGTGVDPGGGRSGEEGRDLRLLGLAELCFLKGFTREMVFGPPPSAAAEEEEEEEEEADPFALPGEEEEEENLPLCRVLTVWGDGRVNLNTAPKEVLAALHEGITEEVARNLVSYREEEAQEADGEAPPPPDEGAAEDPTAEKGYQTVAEARRVEGMIQQDKQLDVLAELLRLTGRRPATGKNAKETYEDAPVTVRSQVFTVTVTARNQRTVRRFTAVMARDEKRRVTVLRIGEGRQ